MLKIIFSYKNGNDDNKISSDDDDDGGDGDGDDSGSYWRSAMTQRYSSLVQIDIQPAVKSDL